MRTLRRSRSRSGRERAWLSHGLVLVQSSPFFAESCSFYAPALFDIFVRFPPLPGWGCPCGVWLWANQCDLLAFMNSFRTKRSARSPRRPCTARAVRWPCEDTTPLPLGAPPRLRGPGACQAPASARVCRRRRDEGVVERESSSLVSGAVKREDGCGVLLPLDSRLLFGEVRAASASIALVTASVSAALVSAAE